LATKIHIHHGDCLEGMRELAAESVDLVVTSPPYNLGIAYRSYDDTSSRETFLSWCSDWAREVQRVLRAEGSFFLNLGAAPSNPLLPHQLLLNLTAPEFFQLQNTFHWIKSISIETRDAQTISAGHFKPINSKRYVNDCHEYLFHLTKSGSVALDRRAAGVPYADKSNIKRWKHTGGSDQRCRGNTWFIPYETIRSSKDQRPHPASFPIALVEQCITLHGQGEESILLDPFLGIGSSALAAQNLNIASFIGFEIDEEYLKIARERLADPAPSPNKFPVRPSDGEPELPL
jgi:site-specific DNA-methyltransferase (adenine-specific)